jgi:hypothetical protein
MKLITYRWRKSRCNEVGKHAMSETAENECYFWYGGSLVQAVEKEKVGGRVRKR